MKTTGTSVVSRQLLAMLLAFQVLNLSIEPRVAAFSVNWAGEIESFTELVAEVVWDIEASVVEHDIADETQCASVDSVNWYFSIHPSLRIQHRTPVVAGKFDGAGGAFVRSRTQEVTCPPPEA